MYCRSVHYNTITSYIDNVMIKLKGGVKASLKSLDFGNPFGNLKNMLIFIYKHIIYIGIFAYNTMSTKRDFFFTRDVWPSNNSAPVL